MILPERERRVTQHFLVQYADELHVAKIYTAGNRKEMRKERSSRNGGKNKKVIEAARVKREGDKKAVAAAKKLAKVALREKAKAAKQKASDAKKKAQAAAKMKKISKKEPKRDASKLAKATKMSAKKGITKAAKKAKPSATKPAARAPPKSAPESQPKSSSSSIRKATASAPGPAKVVVQHLLDMLPGGGLAPAPASAASSGTFTVRTLTGKVLQVPTAQCASRHELVSYIEEKLGIPGRMQRYLHKGLEVSEAGTLSSQGIQDGSTIFLVLRLG